MDYIKSSCCSTKSKEYYTGVLFNILSKNKKCSFITERVTPELVKLLEENKYPGDQLLSQFDKSFQVTEYKDYKQYIDEIFCDGKEDILAAGYPFWFGESGGTTGEPKIYPIFYNLLEEQFPNKRDLDLLNNYCNGFSLDKNAKGVFIIWKKPRKFSPKTNTGIGFISATNRSPHNDTEPNEIKYITNNKDHLFMSVLFAVMDNEIEYLYTVFIPSITDFLTTTKVEKDKILNTLEQGFIDKKYFKEEIDDFEILNLKFKKLLETNNQRQKELIKIFKNLEKDESFKGIASKIWPKLKLIVSNFSSNTLKMHLKTCRTFTTEKVFYTNYLFAATESKIGTPLYFIENGYELHRYSFIEFLEYDEERDDSNINKIISLWDAEKDKLYEVIVTSLNGWVRYRMKDIVKIIGYFDEFPVISYVKRIGWSLSVGGYRINDSYLIDAINSCGIDVQEFIIFENTFSTPNGFGYFIEINHDTYLKDKLLPASIKSQLQDSQNKIDTYFMNMDKFYESALKSEKLSKVKLILVPKNTFDNYREQKAIKNKSMSLVQIKMPLSISSNEMLDYFHIRSSEIEFE